MYPVNDCSSLTGVSWIFRSPAAAASAFRLSSELPGITAMHIPVRSPRATSVLNTCSGGNPIFAATVSAARSSGSTSYSRTSNEILSASRMRTALVFTKWESLRPSWNNTLLHYWHRNRRLEQPERKHVGSRRDCHILLAIHHERDRRCSERLSHLVMPQML